MLDDCIENIISDTVLKVHREEKQARMQSAAILAQKTKDSSRSEASPGGGPTTVTTDGATIDDDDRIFLHSNPLRSTPEILCPTCRRPRLLYPTIGRGARAPDVTKVYCEKQPYIDKDGCDIYGKSLTQEKPSKKKIIPDKKTKAGSRSGSESPTDSPANGKDAGPKPAATSIPSGKCPYCPRYMAFTRLAQHMDRCQKAHSRQAQQTNKTLKTLQGSTPKPAGDKDKEKSKKRKLTATVGSDEEETVDVTPVKKKKQKREKTKEGTPTPTPGSESKKKDKDRGLGTPKPKVADKRPPS